MYKAALTIGVFDMLHEGHINLLKSMDDRAEKVHAIVHNDLSTFLNKKRFPVQELRVRTRNLESLGVQVTPCPLADPSLVVDQLLETLNDVIFIRGDDWVQFPGKDALEALQVPIEYIQYTKGVSSTRRRDEL